MTAFSYVYNDYADYIHKLSYKINREVLKHKKFLIIASSNRFRKGGINVEKKYQKGELQNIF